MKVGLEGGGSFGTSFNDSVFYEGVPYDHGVSFHSSGQVPRCVREYIQGHDTLLIPRLWIDN